jgi:hypothetical protein
VPNKKAKTALPASPSDVDVNQPEKPRSPSTRFGSRADDWLASGDWLAAGEKIKAYPPKRKHR